MRYSGLLIEDPLAPDDLELVKPADAEYGAAPPRRPAAVWAGVALLAVAVLAAGYFMWVRNRKAEPVAAAPAPVEQPQALGGDAAPIVVPALDESDAMVRDLVRSLSSHPLVAAWLATDGLIRNYTVVVVNVSEGKTPAGDLRVLRPASTFSVVERGDNLVIDPRSYQRYDALAAAVEGIDPAGSARVYATLKPRIEEANSELGFSATPFDRTLERAIVLLLETPIVNDPVRVEPHGIGYGFADARLEDLAPAQKQLLRMGPRNVRTIQSSLREIALALGIPAQRLPSPKM